jgi:hypothetical protein
VRCRERAERLIIVTARDSAMIRAPELEPSQTWPGKDAQGRIPTSI